MLITRSKGSRSGYESRELGEVEGGGEEGGGGWRAAGEVEKKRRGDRESEAERGVQ